MDQTQGSTSPVTPATVAPSTDLLTQAREKFAAFTASGGIIHPLILEGLHLLANALEAHKAEVEALVGRAIDDGAAKLDAFR